MNFIFTFCVAVSGYSTIPKTQKMVLDASLMLF